jgi:hypothetical protein
MKKVRHVGVVVTLLTCIQEVSSSNLCRNTCFPGGFYSFYQSLYTHWSRDSSVSVVTRLRCVRAGVRIPAGANPSSRLLNGFLGSFTGTKRLDREVDHSSRSNAEVKSGRSCVSAPPICLHGVDRNGFTCFIYLYSSHQCPDSTSIKPELHKSRAPGRHGE